MASVEAQRGLTTHEAAILGTKVGVGARFHLVGEVAPGHAMGVTVHTTRVADTKRLQDSLGENARVVVRVLVVGDEMVEKKIGLAFFFVPETPRPWGLAVEGVLEAAVEKAAAVSAKKASAKKKRQSLALPASEHSGAEPGPVKVVITPDPPKHAAGIAKPAFAPSHSTTPGFPISKTASSDPPSTAYRKNTDSSVPNPSTSNVYPPHDP